MKKLAADLRNRAEQHLRKQPEKKLSVADHANAQRMLQELRAGGVTPARRVGGRAAEPLHPKR